jgi:superfamily II DNA or RNA helicase
MTYRTTVRVTKRLLSHIDTKAGHGIVSIRAHGTGKNLQAYSVSLVLTPPGSGATWEQLLGRLHRPGQNADEVLFKVWQHTKELRAAFDQALSDASYIETTLGSKQKLSYANIVDRKQGEAKAKQKT